MELTTQQIGKCGELLVQYKLLAHGVESAPMTTDSGIDLVAFSLAHNKVLTIQVKTNLKPNPGGGTGRPHLDWWMPDDSQADLFALVDVAQSRVWIIRNQEMSEIAQQHPKGKYHFFMTTDPTKKPRKDKKPVHDFAFQSFLLEKRIHEIF